MNRRDRDIILGRIRRATASESAERRVSRDTILQDRLDPSRVFSILEESCRDTGTFLEVLGDPEMLGAALLERVEQLGARNVLVYTGDIPGGEGIPSRWETLEKDHNTGSVRFIHGYEAERPGPGEVARIDACVTGCRALVAEGGVCIIDSNTSPGRLGSLLPPHHVVVASKNRFFPGLQEAIEILRKEGNLSGSSTVFVSGPSRTADIEKQLVIGVHGPLTLSLILIP